MAAPDGAAQLRHGQRQCLKALTVEAFGHLCLDFQRCGEVFLLFLQLVAQCRGFAQNQPAVGGAFQRLKHARPVGHQVDVRRHTDLVAHVAGQRCKQGHIRQHLPGVGHDHGRLAGGQRLIVALQLTVDRRNQPGRVHAALDLLDAAQRLVHQVFVRCCRQHALGTACRRVQHQLVIVAHRVDELAHPAKHRIKLRWCDAFAVVQRQNVADRVAGRRHRADLQPAVPERQLRACRLHLDR